MGFSAVASVVVLVLVEAPILAEPSARCARREQKERERKDESLATARRRRHRLAVRKILEKHSSAMSFWSGVRGPLDGVDSALAVSRKAAPEVLPPRPASARLARRRLQ